MCPQKISKVFLLFIAVTFAFSGIISAQGPPAELEIPTQGLLANRTLDFSQARSLPLFSAKRTMFENVLIDGQPHEVLMEWNKNGMRPVSVQSLVTAEIPFQTMTIDGNDSDWMSISSIIEDDLGDGADGYEGTDFSSLRLARDGDYIYCLIKLNDGDPRTYPTFHYSVEFMQHQYQIHTPGDINVTAKKMEEPSDPSWRVEVWVRGVACDSSRVVFVGSDYVEVGTKTIEWKIPISVLQWPPDTPRVSFPPSPLGPQGIENHFVRVFLNGILKEGDDFLPTDGYGDPPWLPLIVNFYSP
jgi:hypothetical protein